MQDNDVDDPLGRWKSGEPLPGAEQAIIAKEKFTDYAMNPDHPRQREANKWKVYVDVGYELFSVEERITSSEDVIAQIRQQVRIIGAVFVRSTTHGPRVEVPVEIVGPAQKSFTLRTIWQYDKGTAYPRLITAIGQLGK